MTVASVKILKELELTWLPRLTCIFYCLNIDLPLCMGLADVKYDTEKVQ